MLRRNRIDTWRPKLVYQRGRLALHRGDLDAAERIFRGYLRELGPDERLRQHETRAYIADILARRGDLAGAERELTAAGDALDDWRATLDDQQLRLMAFQATATDESDRNSSVPRVIAALAAGGRADAAFGLAERRRARELGRRLYEASALESVARARRLTTGDGVVVGRRPDRRAAPRRQHRAGRVRHRRARRPDHRVRGDPARRARGPRGFSRRPIPSPAPSRA